MHALQHAPSDSPAPALHYGLCAVHHPLHGRCQCWSWTRTGHHVAALPHFPCQSHHRALWLPSLPLPGRHHHCHIQHQPIRATHTVSTMQGEIDALNGKKKLAHHTNQNADTQQTIYDTEVRIKTHLEYPAKSDNSNRRPLNKTARSLKESAVIQSQPKQF